MVKRLGLSIILILLPCLVLWFVVPSRSDFEHERIISAGTIETANGAEIDLDLILGDLFRPKDVRRDVGFDLVGVSCFFNPIEIDSVAFLPANPLLVSALQASLRDSSELYFFVDKIFEALDESKAAVKCYAMSEGQGLCEGDPIRPFVWVAYPGAHMRTSHGVKFIAALPLFDPTLLIEATRPEVMRGRLRKNVIRVIRRLVDFDAAEGECRDQVRTIGLAAVGSTSHRGGDAPHFLTFTQGFLAAVEALEGSHPSSNLNRVFLVAYDRHTGQFRADAIDGLRAVSRNIFIHQLTSNGGAKLMGGIVGFLHFLIGFMVYGNAGEIWKLQDRFRLVGTILAVTGVGTALVWGGTLAIADLLTCGNIHLALRWYYASAIVSVLTMFWLAKRFPELGARRALTRDSRNS